mgnify:FL=1
MSDCWFYQVQCQATEAANKVAENAVITWGRALLESLEKIMIKVGTFWIDNDTGYVGGEGSAAWDVRYLTAWLSGMVFFGSLIMAAMMLMMNSRGDDIRKIIMGIIKMVVVSGAAFKVIDLMIEASDAFSKWVIETAIGAADGKFVTRLLDVASIEPNGIGWALIVLGCLVGIAANLLQFAMMECREAILPLVAGIIPLAASAALTDWGQQWLRKTTSWVISFIMMKPAAAIIYAVAIKMVSGTNLDPVQKANHAINTATGVFSGAGAVGEDLGTFIRGLIMMVLAAVALPALIRLITPAAEAMGVGGGALAATAGAVSVVTGAIRVARSTGGSGSAGPPGGSGAAGAPGAPGPGGAMGPTGSGGATGAVGAGGATGAAGKAGAAGATGASGAAGATGATGAAGASGAGASGAAAGAGAAAGPAAVVMVGAEAAHKGVQIARSTGNAAATSGGPSGGGA